MIFTISSLHGIGRYLKCLHVVPPVGSLGTALGVSTASLPHLWLIDRRSACGYFDCREGCSVPIGAETKDGNHSGPTLSAAK